MKVAILGASVKPERYSYKALKMLEENGHTPLPVHPAMEEIEGYKVFKSISDINEDVDTLTMYVNAERSNGLAEDIIALGPRRVIFNPGTENPSLANALEGANIKCIEACTLVLLRTGQF